MNRAELELSAIRTSIEAYNQILKNEDLSEEKVIEIKGKIDALGQIRDKILFETGNYGIVDD